MKLDKSINVGTILHLLGVIITAVLLYTSLVAKITTIEVKVDTMWRVFERKLNAIDGRRWNGP